MVQLKLREIKQFQKIYFSPKLNETVNYRKVVFLSNTYNQ